MENVQTTQYTAPNAKTIIDKFTVTNTSAANVDLSVNLVPPSGLPTSSNLVISERTIAAGETYACTELVGQVLESGGMISTIAGAASALTVYASGREIT